MPSFSSTEPLPSCVLVTNSLLSPAPRPPLSSSRPSLIHAPTLHVERVVAQFLQHRAVVLLGSGDELVVPKQQATLDGRLRCHAYLVLVYVGGRRAVHDVVGLCAGETGGEPMGVYE